MWNKDTIHWLTGPITVDLGGWGRKHENICWFRWLQNLKLCLDKFKCRFWVNCPALSNALWERYPFQMNQKQHECIKWHSLMLKEWFLADTRSSFFLWPLYCTVWSLSVCVNLTSPAQFVPHTLWSFVYCRSSLNAQLRPCLLFTLDWLTMKRNVGPSTRSYSSTATLCRPRGGLVMKRREENDHCKVHKVRPVCFCPP